MLLAKRTLEISVQEINVPVNGAGLLDKTSHLLSAELIWPRVGIPQKASSQPCRLEKGYSGFEKVNWGNRILFKESVEGKFALRISLTEVLDDEELEKFLRSFSGAALAFGADMLAPLYPPFGKLIAAPIDYIAKDIEKYPGPTRLVEGLVELEASDFLENAEQPLTISLITSQSITQSVTRRVAGRIRHEKKSVLSKGEPNGNITLLIRSL
ncbi:MAG: hypothetical protein WCJ02_06020 [bacterium]